MPFIHQAMRGHRRHGAVCCRDRASWRPKTARPLSQQANPPRRPAGTTAKRGGTRTGAVYAACRHPLAD